MSSSFELGEVDRITVGTVGPTGERIFFLQARRGPELVTLKLEKSQVAALCTYLGELLQNAPRPGHLPDDLELEEPAVPEWAVGTLAVTYDGGVDRFLLAAEEMGEEEDDLGEARFVLTREQVAAMAIRGTLLVAAGRPPCPLCGYPLDAKGHRCPRTNGHRPPTL